MELSPTAASKVGVLGGWPVSGTTFTITGGREDLFEIADVTNLMQVVDSDPGEVGDIHYLEIKASNAGVTIDAYYLLEATVGGSGSLGTIILIR
jgi:hypothetical protein